MFDPRRERDREPQVSERRLRLNAGTLLIGAVVLALLTNVLGLTVNPLSELVGLPAVVVAACLVRGRGRFSSGPASG